MATDIGLNIIFRWQWSCHNRSFIKYNSCECVEQHWITLMIIYGFWIGRKLKHIPQLTCIRIWDETTTLWQFHDQSLRSRLCGPITQKFCWWRKVTLIIHTWIIAVHTGSKTLRGLCSCSFNTWNCFQISLWDHEMGVRNSWELDVTHHLELIWQICWLL